MFSSRNWNLIVYTSQHLIQYPLDWVGKDIPALCSTEGTTDVRKLTYAPQHFGDAQLAAINMVLTYYLNLHVWFCK